MFSVAFLVIVIYIRGYYPRFFLRDPVRTPPQRDNVILSPADGRISYIRKIKDGGVPVTVKLGQIVPLKEITQSYQDDIQNGYIVGIIMSFWDVHIQRAPISGTVTNQIYIPGGFFDVGFNAKRMLRESERNVLVMKDPVMNFSTITIQLAAIWVRRIISFVNKGDTLKMGQRYGYVKFGSQVDIIIPDLEGLKFNVEIGQRVHAGDTIIVEYAKSPSGQS